ncbi:PREDICTED: membrane protein FAM174A [Gekko japonicus]|uniref:Transmembrane protein 157 n=1 Tax=Gekko japonicus TaxID=146911 RepID=A0ABM1L788_GEKJA|nr:PREDICTED: membrane protein FAM174A [Gekko japonicus]
MPRRLLLPASPPHWLLPGLLVMAALCGGVVPSAAPASPRPPSVTPRNSSSRGGETTRSGNASNSSRQVPRPEAGQLMTQRALSVLVLASAALIVYFVIRTVRLRRRNRKTRKYGVLDTNIENTELTPLEQDDDDDDTTLFDANHPRR